MTIEELEAELEVATRERDLSLAAWDAAGMTGRTAQSAMLELARQLEETRSDVERLRGVLHIISLDENEPTTSASDKVHAHAKRAREVLQQTTTTGPNDAAHIASLEDLFLKACLRAKRHEDAAKTAYRRGAETMREACAQVDPYALHRGNASYARSVASPASVVLSMQEAIRVLPIPESYAQTGKTVEI